MKKFSIIFFCILCMFLLISCKEEPRHTPYITEKQDSIVKTSLGEEYFLDKRNESMYPLIKIGEQIWFSKNLEIKTPNSYCPEDDEAVCSFYGRLYEWNDAVTACPNGWKLPTKQDFEKLISNVKHICHESDDSKIGTLLKSRIAWDMDEKIAQGTPSGIDCVRFSALPAGRRKDSGFTTIEGANKMRNYAAFWTSDEDGFGAAHYSLYNYKEEFAFGNSDKKYALSVRCLKE